MSDATDDDIGTPPDGESVWAAPSGLWYYVDETQSVYGPFGSRALAEQALEDYIDIELNGLRPRIPLKVLDLLNVIWKLEDEIANDEEALKNKKATLKLHQESDLVELLTERELNHGVRLPDGREYEFERVMHCSVAKPDQEKAYTYLRENGFGAILREGVSISFGKNAEQIVAEFKASVAKLLPAYEISVRAGKAPTMLVLAIKSMLASANLGVTIEHFDELPGSTLRAWVTKQMKLGQPIPEFFGVYSPMKAVLTVADVKPATEPLQETAS